jgi:aspartyl-tRNA(Asn)/glutamyl-tRNA(Gln) amidotransferase subunit A
MSIYELTATELLQKMNEGEITSTEATETYFDRIASMNETIGAYLTVSKDSALETAARIDEKREAGQPLGKLAGLPLSVKDILATVGEKTTCASKMLASFQAPYDATVIGKLKAADAVVLGRTNMDEFAMGGSTEKSAFRLTKNPWDENRTPGGSSGGAAASVAAQMAPLAVGTDTGGSIRQPSAFCGVVGMKPTYGRVSRYGLVAFASSLDQIGPIGRTADDVALLLETLAGHDPRDATSIPQAVPKYSKEVGEPIKPLRLGIVRDHFSEGLDPEVEKAVKEAIAVLESIGATVREIELPHSKYAVATYYIIASSEASSNLARYDGMHYGHRTDPDADTSDCPYRIPEDESALVTTYRRSRSEAFGDEVKRRIMLGTYALSAGYYDAYYLKAQKVRRLLRNDFDRAFQEVDLLVGPVTPSPAFRLGEKVDDPLSMYLVDLYTCSTNLAGIPAISVPCGFSSEGLPIGLHFQAPILEESRLLRAAHMFQRETDWHRKIPSLG